MCDCDNLILIFEPSSLVRSVIGPSDGALVGLVTEQQLWEAGDCWVLLKCDCILKFTRRHIQSSSTTSSSSEHLTFCGGGVVDVGLF